MLVKSVEIIGLDSYYEIGGELVEKIQRSDGSIQEKPLGIFATKIKIKKNNVSIYFSNGEIVTFFGLPYKFKSGKLNE